MTRPDPLEATVAGHTARHLTATTYCQPGRSNTDAAQLIESLHTRAQRRAERRVSVPTRAITTTQPARARNCMNPNNPRSKRRPIRPALIRARGSAAAAALPAVLVCTTHTAPAEAALSNVSPGDRIATPDLCTIGYTYTGTDAHTYALTAGHCASTAPVRDHGTGATGTFVASIVDPPRSGGADYGLVDFGPRTVALTVISGRAAARNLTRPRPGQTVCRSGITTGEQCGSIAAAYGDHQYLTTGMPPSRGGDSGAPVWAVGDDGCVQVLGIWLGGRTTADGHDYGRFAALSSAVSALGITSAD